MRPIEFIGFNKTLEKPEDWTDVECIPLPVYTNGAQCLSCWRASWKERLLILLTGKVWLCLWSGQTQPPTCVFVRQHGDELR